MFRWATVVVVACVLTSPAAGQWSALRHLGKLGKEGDSVARLSDDVAAAVETVSRIADDSPLSKAARDAAGITLEDGVEAFAHSLGSSDSSWRGGQYVALNDGGELTSFRLGEGSSDAVYIESDALQRGLTRDPQTMLALADDGRLRLAIPRAPPRLRILREGGETRFAMEVGPNLYTEIRALEDAVRVRGSFKNRLECEFSESQIRVIAMFDRVNDQGSVQQVRMALPRGVGFSTPPRDPDAIEAMLRAVDEDSIVMVGHIEDGMIVAEDAAGMRINAFPLERAQRIAAERDRHLLVLGCGAGRMRGVSGPLENIDAAETARRLSIALRADNTGEFLGALASSRAPLLLHTVVGAKGRLVTSARTMPLSATAGAAGAGGAALVTAVFIDSRESDLRAFPPLWHGVALIPAFLIGTAGTLGRRMVKHPLLLGWGVAVACSIAAGNAVTAGHGGVLFVTIALMALPIWIAARITAAAIALNRRKTGNRRSPAHA